MRRSSFILMLAWFGLAAAAIAWAAFWPVVLDRPPAGAAMEQDKSAASRPAADIGKSEIWRMRWQSWENKKAVAAAPVAKPAAPVKPAPPPAPAVQKPPGVVYLGAIFENDFAFGFFNTPAGPRYAAAGEVVKFGSESMKVLKIETAGSTVEFQGNPVRLDVERRESRLGNRLRPPTSPAVPPPSMNKPDMNMPIILDRAKM